MSGLEKSKRPVVARVPLGIGARNQPLSHPAKFSKVGLRATHRIHTVSHQWSPGKPLHSRRSIQSSVQAGHSIGSTDIAGLNFGYAVRSVELHDLRNTALESLFVAGLLCPLTCRPLVALPQYCSRMLDYDECVYPLDFCSAPVFRSAHGYPTRRTFRT